MNKTIRTLILSFIMAFSFAASSQETAEELIESLNAKLVDATTTADSIRIMFNILDLSTEANKTPVANEIFDLAIKIGDDDTASQMICWIAFSNRSDDTVLKGLKEKVELIKAPDRKCMANTYVSLRRAGYAARFATAKRRTEMINKSIDDGYFQNTNNYYERIETLGSLCILLGTSNIHRNLLVKYLAQELELLENLPENDKFIKNIMYNYAGIIYSHLDMQKEAIEVGLKRIKLLDSMTEYAHKNGRLFDPYKHVYYSTYLLLLKNHESLTQPQVDEFYAMTQKYAQENEDAHIDNENGTAEANYLMAKGRYAEAIPKLQEVLATSNDHYVKRRAITSLLKAAEVVGDKEALFDATMQYNQLLIKMLKEDAVDANARMQALYQIDDLQKRNAQLALERLESEAKAQRTIAIICICAAVALAFVMIAVFLQYTRTRKLAEKFRKANEALNQESEALRQTKSSLIEARDKATKAERHKTEFINNMSHELTTPAEAIVEYSQLIVDCIQDEKKQYLQRYGDIVKLNASLLFSIINDILEIGVLENSEMSIKKSPQSVNDICKLAIESVANRLRPEVKLIFVNVNNPDTIITTDSKRVGQVLTNLLTNAEKFTQSGSIRLEYKVDHDNYTINFSVTDTGCGIPEGKEEEIFSRFVKLDKQVQGVGLGLSICRMIAQLLHGSVYVDTTYKQGARFIFTIPMA